MLSVRGRRRRRRITKEYEWKKDHRKLPEIEKRRRRRYICMSRRQLGRREKRRRTHNPSPRF